MSDLNEKRIDVKLIEGTLIRGTAYRWLRLEGTQFNLKVRGQIGVDAPREYLIPEHAILWTSAVDE